MPSKKQPKSYICNNEHFIHVFLCECRRSIWNHENLLTLIIIGFNIYILKFIVISYSNRILWNLWKFHCLLIIKLEIVTF